MERQLKDSLALVGAERRSRFQLLQERRHFRLGPDHRVLPIRKREHA
jgi:hypothetical protein